MLKCRAGGRACFSQRVERHSSRRTTSLNGIAICMPAPTCEVAMLGTHAPVSFSPSPLSPGWFRFLFCGRVAFVLGLRQSSACRRWCVPTSLVARPVFLVGTRPRQRDRGRHGQPNRHRTLKPRCCWRLSCEDCHQSFAYPSNYSTACMDVLGTGKQRAKHATMIRADSKAATRQSWKPFFKCINLWTLLNYPLFVAESTDCNGPVSRSSQPGFCRRPCRGWWTSALRIAL